MIKNLTWQEKAICVSNDVEVLKKFYSDDTTEAKKICGNCPVRLDCLQAALDTEERFGVWGGSDEATRRWALSVDQYGKPIQRIRDMKCPNCSGTEINTVARRKVRTHLKCSTCALTWWSRKIGSLHPIDADIETERQDTSDEDMDGDF